MLTPADVILCLLADETLLSADVGPHPSLRACIQCHGPGPHTCLPTSTHPADLLVYAILLVFGTNT